MKKLSLFVGMIAVLFFSGCASLEKKFGQKIGCEEKDVTVERTLMVPAYSQYKVMCKSEQYTCRIAPFSETCSKEAQTEAEGNVEKKK